MKSLQLIVGVAIMLFFSTALLAQVSVKGVVKDDSGEPLIGVTILEKGTSNGTVTDTDGNYSLSVGSKDAVLVFSYIGYTDQEVAIGNQSVIDVTLSENVEELSEVVISALGFKEKRDNISSTYSRVEADKVVLQGENKLIDGLSGKMAGVRISGTSGDPGAGSNISVRGQSTLSGTGQPLIIVDGVPYNNDYLRGLSSEAAQDAGVNQQSRLNDINPADIASFQVYKGASAGAVYGSRGINGVIVITTKRGQKGKPKITFSSSLSIDQISRKHDLQTTFGQGINGNWVNNSATSWGDKIADRSGAADEVNTTGRHFVSYTDGTTYYPITSKNSKEVYRDSNFDQVFQTAYSWNHKLSINGGTDNTTYYFSLSNTAQEGIIVNADYNKLDLTGALTQKITDKFTMDFKANFITSSSNRIQTGSNTGGVYLGLLRMAPDFDATHYIGDYVDDAGVVTPSRQRSYRRSLGESGNPTYNNPLWTVNEQLNTSDVNRFVGTTQFDYKINGNVTLVARGSVDMYNDSRLYFFPEYSAGSTGGELEDEVITSFDYSADFIARLNFNIIEGLTNNTNLGFGLISNSRKNNYSQAINFTENFRGIYAPNQLTSIDNINSEITRYDQRSNRLFGTSTFDYKNMLLMTLSGAYENVSTLKDPFFYPSLELGWIASETFDLPQWINFGKLRFTYGLVGHGPSPYRDQTVYEVGSFSSFSDGLDLVYFGGGYQLNEQLGNPDLKPEIKTENEYGIDLRFLQNRISFSFTYYSNKGKDLFLTLQLPTSVGFETIFGNGADMTNKGVEIETGFRILDKDDWKVGFDVNYSKNKNLVVKTNGSVIDFSIGSSVQTVAIEGYPLGVFYTQGILRDENGNKVFDAHGFPETDLSGNQVVGDPNPDWKGGLGINASYKNLRLNLLFETVQGNDFSQRTNFILGNFGTIAYSANEVTLTKDMYNYAGDLIPAGTTVRGNIHNFGGGDVLLDQSWYTTKQGFGDAVLNELTITDGSWTRLREASISYTLRKGLPKGIDYVELSAAGRNLIIWTGVEGVDPDINQQGVGFSQGIDYFTNPGARTFIFTLRLGL